ncbi:uncharacterized protein LY79DRAFT_666884 [Colletotrichum navitas]|uniref:Uncharacterized protein n=1 Tax=Colletotrichum navitas TaxID=681940 RepID=A0AAD8V8P9_9PEZI|nr:uncharacterized protein LY79DRAFT_666884 [Colletotrichum navitas]KAK1597139.1 hypothetical protein LY79DRAFT_666884 [Colletotrichum navitas]
MSSNGFSRYTVPYSGVVGTANFVPGAAAHPPAPQDKRAQGGFRLPVVASEPVTASTARSKGESTAMGAAAGDPFQDAIPARFASARVSAAGGGIAIVPDGLDAGGFPSSSEIYAASGLGQVSGQKKEQLKGVSLNNKDRLRFGTDGQYDDEGMPPSPTLMTMSAQRHSDRALPVIARELKAVKEENQRLRDANLRLQSRVINNDISSNLVASLQSTNKQLETQTESLYKQMADIQQQAQRFLRHRNRLRARLINTEDSLMELVDLIVRLENIISRIDPDIFVTFPYEVQRLLTSIHEEWKYQEYCKCFKPEELEDDASSVSTIIEPQNAVRDESLSLIIGSSYETATVSSAVSGDASSNGLKNDPSKADDAAANASKNDSINPLSGIVDDISNAELLRQLFQDHTISGPSTKGSGQQTPRRVRPSENLLDFSSPGTPSSIGTPRTAYSGSSENGQGTGVTHGLQTSQTVHDAQNEQGAESTETNESMTTAADSFDSLGIHNNIHKH